MERDSQLDLSELRDIQDLGEDLGTTTRCEEEAPEGRACIEGGWFELPIWSTVSTAGPVYPPQPPENVPTYIDAFLLDVHEVTNAAYEEFVTLGEAPPIPDDCGHLREEWRETITDFHAVVQASPWSGGAPKPELLDHPVLCVTREEAKAYCAAHGGHLPTVFEMMRAVRGLSPRAMRTPWGDEPPPPQWDPWHDDLSPDWYAPYGVLGASSFDDTEIQTGPAGAETLGVSVEGVRGLVGNASEMVADCSEDLYNYRYPVPERLVRPASPTRDYCTKVVVGSNWRSDTKDLGAYGLAVFNWGRTGFAAMTSLYSSWPMMGHDHMTIDAESNPDRNWRVGFRCAYDLD